MLKIVVNDDFEIECKDEKMVTKVLNNLTNLKKIELFRNGESEFILGKDEKSDE